MQQLPPAALYAVVGSFAALENVFPPLPADTAVAAGAVLAVGGRASLWGVFLATWVGNVSSAAAVYGGARTVGRRFFHGRIGRRLLRREHLARLERLYERHGVWAIFVSRFVPGLRAVVPPFAGVANVGWVRGLLPVIIASGLWYGAVTLAAATLVRNLGEIEHLLTAVNRGVLVVVGTTAVGGVAWWLFRRHARRARQ